MFDSLSGNLSKIFSKITSRGVINPDDVAAAMREVRIALLEADVSLQVVKEFIANVSEKAVGEKVIKSVSPGQVIIKIVHEELTKILEGEPYQFKGQSNQAATFLMVGLQGSGKTTSSAKLALWLRKENKKKILLASLDTHRPAAQEQLAILAKQVNIDSLPIIQGETPEQISKRALSESLKGGYDALILDSAGRLHVDNALMDELEKVRKITNPNEIFLVADAMTGQDAVNIASAFGEKFNLTGIILTRIDGDSRGGAALSMKVITGKSIKFVGVGEKLNDFELFYPERVASRILDMGDIVSLVERASNIIDKKEAEDMATKFAQGSFDLNDMMKQLNNMKKMGGIGNIAAMIPGLGKIKNAIAESGLEDKLINRQIAIISSMTKHERKNPKIINGSRRKRIAKGSGVEVFEVNKLLKQFMDMANMMGKFSKMDKKSFMRSGMLKNLF